MINVTIDITRSAGQIGVVYKEYPTVHREDQLIEVHVYLIYLLSNTTRKGYLGNQPSIQCNRTVIT